jgi:hypothetical protein
LTLPHVAARLPVVGRAEKSIATGSRTVALAALALLLFGLGCTSGIDLAGDGDLDADSWADADVFDDARADIEISDDDGVADVPADAAADVALDAEADADAAPPITCGLTVECSDAPSMQPLLSYAFDGDLANRGTASVTSGTSSGVFRYVEGVRDRALSLPLDVWVTLRGTAEVLADHDELTFSVWARKGTSDADFRAFLSNRGWLAGFEVYSSYAGLTACAGIGGGPPVAWGACATVPACDNWTQWVLRWRRGSEPEVASSAGGFVPMLAPSYPIGDFDLFDGAPDLRVGLAPGDGVGARGTIEVDEVRVYAGWLDDATVWQVTGCPSP